MPAVSEWIDRTAVFVVALATERVEGHRDVRRVALAVLDEFPVVAESGNEADVVFHPAVRDVAGFDQVDDGEQHQRLMRRNASGLRAKGVEIGEFAKPVCTFICLHSALQIWILVILIMLGVWILYAGFRLGTRHLQGYCIR